MPYEELLVPLADKKGPDVTLFLNRDYLVKALSFDMTRIDIIDETSPVRCAGKTEFMIIMPGPRRNRFSSSANGSASAVGTVKN